MKCEHCGKNEVTFVYRSSINGAVTETRLCSECAQQLGYTQSLTECHQRLMQGFDRMWNGSLLEEFFPVLPNRRMWEHPFDDLFAAMPALGPVRKQSEQPEQPSETLVSQEEQAEYSRLREMNALRLALQKAVQEEAYEHAAELRDQLRALEKQAG